MRTFIKAVIILSVIGALGYFGTVSGLAWLAEHNKPRFRVASVERGDLRITVNAAGQLEHTLSVKVGSFVSGPILELLADHNDEVKAKQVLARIDPRIYVASVQRDEAALGSRKGDVARVQASCSVRGTMKSDLRHSRLRTKTLFLRPNSISFALHACRWKLS